ncbi:NUDIX hydrolase, partial [Dokdonella sp.]|uniref:NUDIX hydrolase n=1 Tax=Dokdonella sp. TaxID=2291710 RepID=UPI003AF5D7EF
MNAEVTDLRWLRRAVRSLEDQPAPPGWNLPAIADGLDSAQPQRDAAVLVPFVRRGDALSVLFTRRTQGMRQHPGQISFPGGGSEAGDSGPVATALRETSEETGIQRALIEPFGYLDCLATVSGYCVTPVTAFVRGDYVLRLQPEEVDEAFEVPLDFILTRQNWREEQIAWQGRLRDIRAFEWQHRRVWG